MSTQRMVLSKLLKIAGVPCSATVCDNYIRAEVISVFFTSVFQKMKIRVKIRKENVLTHHL